MKEMVKVFRFMSGTEHRLLTNGLHIANHIDYRKYRCGRSTAIGFTFGIGDKNMAIYASRRLKGVVTMQWLMVAEADRDLFTDGMGFYPSAYNSYGDVVESKWYDELCLIRYSLKMFHNYQFYLINGISQKCRTAFIGGTANRKEQELLQAANKIAGVEYYRIIQKMHDSISKHDYLQWRVDFNKGIMRIPNERRIKELKELR